MPQPDNANSPAQPTNKPTNEPPGKPAATPASPPRKPAKRAFQAPKGTRDWYPADANLRRYITEAWRNASIRHGFEEIDGPTLEDADLYKVKSGDGILAEMFGVFSGKSPEDVAQVRETGEAPLVLRPEFTPTLARMVAARAAQLPKPTKWFTAGPFFRAERPQRGRLREFLQWNVDFVGLPAVPDAPSENAKDAKAAKHEPYAADAERAEARRGERSDAKVGRLSEPDSLPPATEPPAHVPLAEARARADAECIACCIELLRQLGLTSNDVKLRINDRSVVTNLLLAHFEPEQIPACLSILDQRSKSSESELQAAALARGLDADLLLGLPETLENQYPMSRLQEPEATLNLDAGRGSAFRALTLLGNALDELVVHDWCVPDLSIVRGLAYYTGMVFEVIADGERAVAGGGRYDNLIELFGGPPTPAVGFGMGDVVLTNLLRDKGLLPEGAALLDRLSAPPASSRPDAFVFTADEALDPIVRRLVADLRRGTGHSPLHARHPYKATRNIGKLLKEAAAQHARVAVIIESDTTATIKPLDGGEQSQCAIADAPDAVRRALA
ncbi:MAG: ATP phosphoribosyltransferase regulatory subunit [Phycisphaerales bacterium]